MDEGKWPQIMLVASLRPRLRPHRYFAVAGPTGFQRASLERRPHLGSKRAGAECRRRRRRRRKKAQVPLPNIAAIVDIGHLC